MRIGRTIIDTDNMSVEDMDVIIREMRSIRARKLKAEELKSRMFELIADAKENGFYFVDKDFEQAWTSDDIELYDERV